jgi:hypothetical protein
MLVYFDPAALCGLPNYLILAPLPSKKRLWEANDEFMWKKESETERGIQTTFGMAANGDLLSLSEGQMSSSDAVLLHKGLDSPLWSTANWEEWCSGMDGFGGLIMLAASLVG